MKKLLIEVPENDKVYTLLIGQNQKENDTILKTAAQNDIWFHLENISGPHFVLQNAGDIVPKRYLNHIAGMFPLYKRGLQRYSVIYTERCNVRLTKTMGQVIPSNVQRICI